MTAVIDRHDDTYAWLLEQARAIEVRQGIDYAGLSEFIEEAAAEIMSKATSQMVNLMAHVMKVLYSRNPDVAGHWRSEIAEFHDQILDAYRPSMRRSIDMDKLWRRARRKAEASFIDHGEGRVLLPVDCPFTLEMLLDENLIAENLIMDISVIIDRRRRE